MELLLTISEYSKYFVLALTVILCIMDFFFSKDLPEGGIGIISILVVGIIIAYIPIINIGVSLFSIGVGIILIVNLLDLSKKYYEIYDTSLSDLNTIYVCTHCNLVTYKYEHLHEDKFKLSCKHCKDTFVVKAEDSSIAEYLTVKPLSKRKSAKLLKGLHKQFLLKNKQADDLVKMKEQLVKEKEEEDFKNLQAELRKKIDSP